MRTLSFASFFAFVFLFASAKSQNPDCTGQITSSVGDFTVSWKGYAGQVQFDASVTTANGTWLAVGLTSNSEIKMVPSDIVIGSINDNGESFVEDRWAASYQMPTYDEDQNIRDTSMATDDGMMYMSFVRDIYSGNINTDTSLSDRCVYVLVAWGGAVTQYSSPATFGKHTNKEALQQLVCLHECKDGITSTSSSSAVVTSTAYSSTPKATNDSSGFELSTTYIIVIAVVLVLVTIMLLLFTVLICVCVLTRSKGQTTVYELDAATQQSSVQAQSRSKTDAVYRQQDKSHMVTIPLNEYQQETVEDQANIYDKVAPDEPNQMSYEEMNPTPLYDLPPPIDLNEAQQGAEKPPPVKPLPYGMRANEELGDRPPAPLPSYDNSDQVQQPYEHMQYDPIRHLLN